MKTIKELKSMLLDLRADHKTSHTMNKRKFDKLRNPIETAILFLETKPREEFIKQSFNKVKERIENIDMLFYCDNYLTPASKAKLRRKYNSEQERPKYKKQADFLTFLLTP